MLHDRVFLNFNVMHNKRENYCIEQLLDKEDLKGVYFDVFEGVCAKITRAGSELASLKVDMDEFCRDMQQRIVHKFCEKSNEHVWIYCDDTPNPPIEWSIRIGEILYNLRSALDHLVWQLVLANNRTPVSRNAFPIIRCEENWQQVEGKLKGVSHRVAETIERLQPCTGGMGFPFDVRDLWMLHKLCNIDKHRKLILTVVCSRGTKRIEDSEIRSYRQSFGQPLQGWGTLGKVERNKILLRMNHEIHPTFNFGVNLGVNFEEAEQS